MPDCPLDQLCACLRVIFQEGFPAAKARFHEDIDLTHSYGVVLSVLLHKHVYCRALGYVGRNLRREGFHARLVYGLARVTLRHSLGITKRLVGKILRRPLGGFRRSRVIPSR